MTTDNNTRNARNQAPAGVADFSFGVMELDAAERRRKSLQAATLVPSGSVKLRRSELGFDPYNSGSAERRQPWSRVAKRS